MVRETPFTYWAPVIGRLLIVAVLAVVVGTATSSLYGLIVAVLALLVYLVAFATSVYRAHLWISADDLTGDLPDSPQFSKLASWLYRARRREHTARAVMDETLEKFQRTLARLPDGVVLLDTALNIQWCNPVAEEHLSISLSRDAGLRLTNLVRDPAFVHAMLQIEPAEPIKVALGQPPRSLRVTFIRFESGERLVVTSDVSQSERVNQMRQDFIANVSHELRTPLTVLSGFLELANASAPIQEEHLRLMRAESQRMRSLIDDLLTLSKLESSERTSAEEEFELGGLIRRLLESARALSAGRHQITAEGDMPPVFIRGNRVELESAVGNLLSNAIRYTPANRGIAVMCDLQTNELLIEVRDQGPGIAAEHIPRLAERFYRVDKSRSRDTGGTGLGLAIVKHVMLRHQGSMEVRSVVGEGSTFALRIPKQRLIINK
jgi:two-component system, OmpR family, phosphate regulon sensor histidine kinase PhoR